MNPDLIQLSPVLWVFLLWLIKTSSAVWNDGLQYLLPCGSQQWTNNPAALDFPLVCSSFTFLTDTLWGDMAVLWRQDGPCCGSQATPSEIIQISKPFSWYDFVFVNLVTRLYHRTSVFKLICFPDLLHGWFQPAMQIDLWCVGWGLGFGHLLRWDFFSPLEKNVSSANLQ